MYYIIVNRALTVRAELHKREDIRLVQDMKKALGLQDYQTEAVWSSLQEYRQILGHQFNNDRRHEQMNLTKFLSTADGSRWEHTGSKLLFLHGRNAVSDGSDHSWLSPVAVDQAMSLLEANRPITYEGFAQESKLELAMSHIICQLLERDPSLIRRADDFKDVTSQLSRSSNSIDARLRALSRIVCLHDKPVCIVLNRPDLSEGSCAELIEMMLSLVKEAKAELRVLVVQRTELWDVERNLKEVKLNDIDPAAFQRVRMDQHRRRS